MDKDSNNNQKIQRQTVGSQVNQRMATQNVEGNYSTVRVKINSRNNNSIQTQQTMLMSKNFALNSPIQVQIQFLCIDMVTNPLRLSQNNQNITLNPVSPINGIIGNQNITIFHNIPTIVAGINGPLAFANNINFNQNEQDRSSQSIQSPNEQHKSSAQQNNQMIGNNIQQLQNQQNPLQPQRNAVIVNNEQIRMPPPNRRRNRIRRMRRRMLSGDDIFNALEYLQEQRIMQYQSRRLARDSEPFPIMRRIIRRYRQ